MKTCKDYRWWRVMNRASWIFLFGAIVYLLWAARADAQDALSWDCNLDGVTDWQDDVALRWTINEPGRISEQAVIRNRHAAVMRVIQIMEHVDLSICPTITKVLLSDQYSATLLDLPCSIIPPDDFLSFSVSGELLLIYSEPFIPEPDTSSALVDSADVLVPGFEGWKHYLDCSD